MAADGNDMDGAQENKVLPMDAMLEIAAGTDPTTVVRLAATCKDLRRYIGDPSSFCRRRLRLRHGERLVPYVLGGQFVGKWGKDLYIEDRATNLIGTGCFRHDNESCVPITARHGLVLVRVHHPPDAHVAVDLRVCCPTTGRVQSLPPGPDSKGQFVLLVGDGEGGAVGRPFKVLNVTMAAAPAGQVRGSRRHSFQFQMFSSTSNNPSRWGHLRPPDRHRYHHDCSLPALPGRHLVLGDVVHWLYRDRSIRRTYYVFNLYVANVKAGLTVRRLTSTKLPSSFPRELPGRRQILLAATAAGSPVVLVANHGRISAWTMSEDGKRWADQPHVVIDYEAMKRFGNVQGRGGLGMVQLEWFAERSGVVQVTTNRCGFFWLHLQSRKIIRHFPGSLYARSCPYEIDLSSWVPTLTAL